MSRTFCPICHRTARVDNPELRATLCHEDDNTFLAWYATHPGRDATDWPPYAERHRPAPVLVRVDQANTLHLWHQYREQATAS